MIIPTHNRQESLSNCIRSLAGQSYPREKVEVIVIDDGSSPPVDLQTLPFHDLLQIRLVRQDRQGPARARNEGARHALGKWLAFMDDDCAPHVDWLFQIARAFDRFPGAAVTGRTVNLLVDDPYASAAQLLVDYLYSYYNAIPHAARFVTSNNFALPASAFRSLGGFHEDFRSAGGEDREFCDRWVGGNYSVIFVPEAVMYHKHSMSLGGFFRQQFNYGRGAFHFNRLRSAKNGRSFAIEPIGFYRRMFQYAYQTQARMKAHQSALLFAISQIANIAGFAFEGLAYYLRQED